MINIGVIGYGYWGPNLVRNFMNNSDTCVLTVCDVTKTRLEKVKTLYPNIGITLNSEELITNLRLTRL